MTVHCDEYLVIAARRARSLARSIDANVEAGVSLADVNRIMDECNDVFNAIHEAHRQHPSARDKK